MLIIYLVGRLVKQIPDFLIPFYIKTSSEDMYIFLNKFKLILVNYLMSVINRFKIITIKWLIHTVL